MKNVGLLVCDGLYHIAVNPLVISRSNFYQVGFSFLEEQNGMVLFGYAQVI